MKNSEYNTLANDPLFRESTCFRSFQSKPLGFVDVGARGGVHQVVRPVAGITAVLAFEPDQKECDRMKSETGNSPWFRCDFEPVALGHVSQMVPLHTYSGPVNDSLRAPNSSLIQRYNIPNFKEVGLVEVQTATLDQLLFEHRAEESYCGEFLKLDAQGTEFEILQGAARTLSERTVAILAEVEFCELYEGQHLFSEVELYLRQQGFTFYGFASMHYRSQKRLNKLSEAGRERPFWADAVFFKDPMVGGAHSRTMSERGHFVLFVCALLLGYYDFALELALRTWAEGEEEKRIGKLVHKLAHLPVVRAQDEVLALAERIHACPDRANLEVGRFVDERRFRFSDYDDVESLKGGGKEK